MRVQINNAGRFALVLTLLLITVLISTAVMAQSPVDGPALQVNPNALLPAQSEAEIQLDPRAAGAAFKVLPPGAFSSDGSNPDGFFMLFSGGYLTGTSPIDAACLVAPLDVPVGMTITGFEVRMSDGQASFGTYARLDRLDLETGIVQNMADVYSPVDITGGRVWLVDNTIVDPVISNMAAYQVTTCVYEDIFLYGVRVAYQSETMLPLVVK